MKRKILASLMCLLMMATLLPVGSMATETPLLPNGDFEENVDAFGNPYGWLYHSYDANTGAERVVTDATADVQPQSGEKAVKIKGGSDNSRTYFYKNLTNLVAGKNYIVEGYINLPSEAKFAAGISKGTSNEAYQFTTTSIAFVNMYSSSLISAKKTDGWLKVAKVFKYEPASEDEKWYLTFRAISANDIYLDNFSIKEYDGIYEIGMDDYSNSTSLGLTNMITLGGLSTHKVDSNGEGYVESTTMRGQNTMKIDFATMKKFIPDLATAATLKLSWRMKMVEATELTDVSTWRLNLRFIKTGLSTNYGYYIKFVESGEWAQYEFYFDWDPENNSFDQIQISGLTAYLSSGSPVNATTTPYTATYHIDDIAIEKVDSAYIGSGKTLDCIAVNSAYSGSDPVVTVSGYGRTIMDATYESDETVMPFVRFATAEANGDTALTMTAVYKNEGSKRQLLNVITENLNATSTAAVYSTGTLDLSTLGLTAEDGVTYSVETYLWDGTTVTPLTNKVSAPITVAAATE